MTDRPTIQCVTYWCYDSDVCFEASDISYQVRGGPVTCIGPSAASWCSPSESCWLIPTPENLERANA